MKKLYDLGEMPPTGAIPDHMYASVIRQDRFGPPEHAFRTEIVDVPPLGRDQVLVYVMAAGINYNNVWAALGHPVDVIDARQRAGAPEDFHIGGSECSGIVWAVGDGVRTLRVGDHVVVSSAVWDESAVDIRDGADPIASTTQRAWGYETNYGAFAQFAPVYEYQCVPKPERLSWTEAAAFMLTGATAYRQLTGWHPNVVRPGDPVLVWGGAGGLGSMAIQIAQVCGGLPVAVVSNPDRAEYCRKLGAQGVINRTDFTHWGRLPDIGDTAAFDEWLNEVRRFGRKYWEELGEMRSPAVVLEHTGQQTLPTSLYLCDNAGMVVICGGTTGYHGDVDLRFLWMRQKRLQGSHFANRRQCRELTELVAHGYVDPCLGHVADFADIGQVHQIMRDNRHPAGNLAVRVNAMADRE
ncbi:crotonyl-CoA carboxylase/reductase [Rhodococcus sp. AG1013]|uniref:crotonyl-CoA carboxylase/reductase n=1 Tax=Rhodococcus sp. AG1013 TaxID=2183996 RepID=UPI000E0C74A2|nr:crotonyl-CoA carboxylase/reductase [Rhodococcus sp. AG1013]RDI17650.1 crotonyl-CoA carboxylase/reductase [Rhodococcus sp. AG1013]